MRIDRLTRAEKAEAVAVLHAAFHDYPVLRFMLKTSGNDYDRHLNAIFSFYCEARFAKDGIALGIRNTNSSLVAVGLVDPASHKPWDQLQMEMDRLKSIIGDDAYSRLLLYEDLSSRPQPKQPHHYLGIIGVNPNQQGKGYGRAILDHVRALSENDPQSTGVCLSTEDPSNVKIYQHFGYRILAEIDIEELHSWCMFLQTK